MISPKNKIIDLTLDEITLYENRLLTLDKAVNTNYILDKTICQDCIEALHNFPENSIDLLIADPPYNLTKEFNTLRCNKLSVDEYQDFTETWVNKVYSKLKSTSSIYICSDWHSSFIQNTLQKYFMVQNRITWEREKGRGALKNWKNCSEDIWFCTKSKDYNFNVEAVKLKKKVIAPYRDNEGEPKDWEETDGGKFRLTSPSNLWTDITIPFWSMPENTCHPTQKPEKLIAKLILASSNIGDVVVDPFLGSGTTSVVSKKLGRHYIGIEFDRYYCCLAEKRLDLANVDSSIQGYYDNVFWERNSLLYKSKY